MNVKKYWLFVEDVNESPDDFMDNYIDEFNTIEEAKASLERLAPELYEDVEYFYNILDTEAKEYVDSGELKGTAKAD